MQFVVMDLEWNNTYAKKANGYINEIIEIGAVKLDEDLENIDTFSCIIRSQIGKKLRGTVKRLTQLTNADDQLHKEYFEGTGIEIIPFSSVTRVGKDEVWKKIIDKIS